MKQIYGQHQNKKNISLVTGGAGFIGSHVVDNLITQGHSVVVLDDLSGGFERNINSKALFVKGSTTNHELVHNLFEICQINYVYHLAAYAAEGLSHFIRRFNYENNLIGSINLINESVKHNIDRFVFTSSIAVYGANQTPMVESLDPQPEDPYGISKYAVEKDLEAAHRMFGLNYTIFRPHNVYGERQNHGDPYRNVLGIFINNIMKGLPMTIFGDGKQTRAFSYIGDVAPYIAKSVETEGTENEIFNIGSDQPVSVLELANLISNAFGMVPNIVFLPSRKEVIDAFSDHSKAKKIFNIQFNTPLGIGISKMVSWAKEIGPANPKKFENIEVEKNMPPSWLKLMNQ